MLGIRTVGDLLFSTCKALGLTSETEKKIPTCSQVVSKDAVGLQAHPL